jgi:hypothetical protein
MKKMLLLISLIINQVYAFDVDGFQAKGLTSLDLLARFYESEDFKPITEVQTLQNELLTIASFGIEIFQFENEHDRGLLQLITSNLEEMKNLSSQEIELQWHDCQVPQSFGFNCDSLGHYSKVRGLMDSIIHPATAYILMNELKSLEDDSDEAWELIDQAIEEIQEAIEHVEYLR